MTRDILALVGALLWIPTAYWIYSKARVNDKSMQDLSHSPCWNCIKRTNNPAICYKCAHWFCGTCMAAHKQAHAEIEERERLVMRHLEETWQVEETEWHVWHDSNPMTPGMRSAEKPEAPKLLPLNTKRNMKI